MRCDNSTSSSAYKGTFGDRYVFLEFQSNSVTSGDSGTFSIDLYAFRDDQSMQLSFPPPISEPYEQFDMFYGLNMNMTGSYSGKMKIVQKVKETPHDITFNRALQQEVPVPVDVSFTDISEDSEVILTFTATAPDSMQNLQYNFHLMPDSTVVIPIRFDYPMEVNGDSVLVSSEYSITNYGFQQKQDIVINTGS